MNSIADRIEWTAALVFEVKGVFEVSRDDFLSTYVRIFKSPIPTCPPKHSTINSMIQAALPFVSIVRGRKKDGDHMIVVKDKEKLAHKFGNVKTASIASKGGELTTSKINKHKSRIRPIHRGVTCQICGLVARETVYVGSCKHLFCHECILAKQNSVAVSDDDNWEDEVQAPNKKMTDRPKPSGLFSLECAKCQHDISTFALRTEFGGEKAKLSNTILWMLHHEMPFRCSQCGFIEVISRLTKSHKCGDRQPSRIVKEGTLTTQALVFEYLLELLLTANRAMMRTRICGHFKASRSFKPSTFIKGDVDRSRYLTVKADQAINLIAHPANSILGYCCVQGKNSSEHKWIPTTCLIPVEYSPKKFEQMLTDLNWQQIPVVRSPKRLQSFKQKSDVQ